MLHYNVRLLLLSASPPYLQISEVSTLLFYIPHQRHKMLFDTLWNTTDLPQVLDTAIS